MQHTSSEPFTRQEALRRGVTVHALAGPRYQRLFHGLYLPTDVQVTVLQRARAALKISPPGSFVSHHTAAAVWGGCAPDTADTHVSVPVGPRTKRRGIHAHRAPGGSTAVRYRDVLLSPPMQTFLEMAAARVDLVDLVVLGDSLLKSQHITADDLRDAASSWVGAGAALARRAAALVRDGVDSPPETRLRMLIVLAGLPEPKVNVVLRSEGGAWHRRFDLCFPELRLVIEYDGRYHQSDLRQWSRDILRREELEAEGWRMIVINADALFNHPSGTLARITDALAARGARLPRRTPAAWHRHFRDRSPSPAYPEDAAD